jgi:hypothetical protein
VEKALHVHVEDNAFRLSWKQAGTVLSEVTIPKNSVAGQGVRDASVRYPDLAQRIVDEWNQGGTHRDRSDRKVDNAIVHTDNRTPFAEVAAVLDAIATPKRDLTMADGHVAKIAALNPVFSVR